MNIWRLKVATLSFLISHLIMFHQFLTGYPFIWAQIGGLHHETFWAIFMIVGGVFYVGSFKD